MKQATSLVLRTAVAALLAVVVASPAAALHSVFLSVPNHSEEALTWCGTAVGEMIIEGFPSGACAVDQADVWAAIDANRVETVWDTDPVGLEKALETVCPPPHWSVFARTDAAELMYSVAYWMTQNDFPAAVVLDTDAHNSYAAHQEHWVVVKGIITDVDPTSSSTVTLQHIWITDPSPATFGDPAVERFIAASTWYGELSAVSKATSTYDGNFVAVIEPPERRGRLVAEAKEILFGEVLDPDRIRELAMRWLEKIEMLRELKPFAPLYRTRPLEPLLVDPKEGGYYIVPFSAEGEEASHALLINAYKGNFQEAGAFAPMRYLSEKEAAERALKFLRIRQADWIDAVLLHAPEAGSTSRYDPVWRLAVDRQVVAVRQNGSVRFWPRPNKPQEPR